MFLSDEGPTLETLDFTIRIEDPEGAIQIPFSQRCLLRNPIPINKIS